MFRYAEEGTLQMLWVTATNPAVSLPELARIRNILSQQRLLVVQDMFMTETAELADVVGRTIYHFHTRTKTARAPQLSSRRTGRVGGGFGGRRWSSRHRRR